MNKEEIDLYLISIYDFLNYFDKTININELAHILYIASGWEFGKDYSINKKYLSILCEEINDLLKQHKHEKEFMKCIYDFIEFCKLKGGLNG